MQNAKLKVGVTVTGLLALMDQITGQKIESAVFSNFGIMGNTNPGLCSFSFLSTASSSNPQVQAIPLVAGSATLSIISDVSWTDQNGDTQSALAMQLSKPYNVVPTSDGVALDIIF